MALTPNQGLILPDGTDNANVPLSVSELVQGTSPTNGLENRLVERYLSIADRTARNPAPVEGEFSYLADLNRYDSYNGTLWVPVMPGALFFGRQTVSQNLPNAASTAVTFDTEDIDNLSGHSGGTPSRYTAQVAGWYSVEGGGSFAANGTGIRTVQITKNGVDVPGSGTSLPASAALSLRMTTRKVLVSAIVGDFFEITMFQNSGGILATAVTSTEQASFVVQWVGPL